MNKEGDSIMKKPLKEIIQLIDSFALEIVMLDPEDIPALGNALKSLESIEALAKKIKEESMISLTLGMRGYLERVVLRETSDLSPFESGVTELQELCRDLASGKKSGKDILQGNEAEARDSRCPYKRPAARNF